MSHTVEAIARATGLTLLGDGSVVVRGPAEPSAAGRDELALAMSPSYAQALRGSGVRAAVVWEGADWQALGLAAALVAPRPRIALAGITAHFRHPPEVAPGIHPSAVIAPDADIGDGVAVGPFVVIGPGARIGPDTVIGAHASVGAGAALGSEALLHDGVRIGARCTVGARFIAQPNAVVGADGFSFEPAGRGIRESAGAAGGEHEGYLRIHSLAGVEIGDDVEIGAGACIDRGTIAPTRIGSGTKIDNQVQIGHNVQVGRTCLICAQVGIAGSTTVGDRVVIGGKVGIPDHVRIGSDVMIAAGSLIAGNVPARSVYMGIPAIPRMEALRQMATIRRLPRLADQLAEIRQRLGL